MPLEICTSHFKIRSLREKWTDELVQDHDTNISVYMKVSTFKPGAQTSIILSEHSVSAGDRI